MQPTADFDPKAAAKKLLREGRSGALATLMLDERKPGDPLQGARVILMGTAAVSEDKDVRRRYLERQPEAEMFAGFGDFAFYRIVLNGAHLVAGFGRIVDLRPG